MIPSISQEMLYFIRFFFSSSRNLVELFEFIFNSFAPDIMIYLGIKLSICDSIKRIECSCALGFFPVGENVRIHQALSNANMQSRFIGTFQLTPRLVDTPNHTVQGFIVNKKCKHVENVFLQQEPGIVFKNNNFWLFIDNDDTLELNESIVGFHLDVEHAYMNKGINQEFS